MVVGGGREWWCPLLSLRSSGVLGSPLFSLSPCLLFLSGTRGSLGPLPLLSDLSLASHAWIYLILTDIQTKKLTNPLADYLLLLLMHVLVGVLTSAFDVPLDKFPEHRPPPTQGPQSSSEKHEARAARKGRGAEDFRVFETKRTHGLK